jgi:hypothetical protein
MRYVPVTQAHVKPLFGAVTLEFFLAQRLRGFQNAGVLGDGERAARDGVHFHAREQRHLRQYFFAHQQANDFFEIGQIPNDGGRGEILGG